MRRVSVSKCHGYRSLLHGRGLNTVEVCIYLCLVVILTSLAAHIESNFLIKKTIRELLLESTIGFVNIILNFLGISGKNTQSSHTCFYRFFYTSIRFFVTPKCKKKFLLKYIKLTNFLLCTESWIFFLYLV